MARCNTVAFTVGERAGGDADGDAQCEEPPEARGRRETEQTYAESPPTSASVRRGCGVMPAMNNPPTTDPMALMLCTAPTAPACAVKFELHDRGHRRLEVVRHQTDDDHHDQRSHHVGMRTHVAQPVAQLTLRPLKLWPRHQLAGTQHEQRGDHEQIRRRVDEEARRDTEATDDQAGDPGAEQPAGREDGAVDADGTGETIATDELEDDRLHRGTLDGHHESVRQRKAVDPPDRDVVGRDDDAERQRQHARQQRRDHEQAAVLDTIGEHARERPEHQQRCELQRDGDAQPVAAIGQLQHQPRLRERLHPRADGRQQLSGEVDAEVARLERREPRAPARTLGSVGHTTMLPWLC